MFCTRTRPRRRRPEFGSEPIACLLEEAGVEVLGRALGPGWRRSRYRPGGRCLNLATEPVLPTRAIPY